MIKVKSDTGMKIMKHTTIFNTPWLVSSEVAPDSTSMVHKFLNLQIKEPDVSE
jgi:hypothetical protein